MKMLGLFVIWLICGLGAIVSWVWMGCGLLVGSKRSWTLAIAYDQLVNAAIGGDPDETISSRAARGRNRGEKRWCYLCKVLDWIDKDHCDRSLGT